MEDELEDLKRKVEGLQGLAMTAAAAQTCLLALAACMPIDVQREAKTLVIATLGSKTTRSLMAATAGAGALELEIRRMADLCFPVG